MPSLRLRLLGGFHLFMADGAGGAEDVAIPVPRRKSQALLAYLACPSDRVHPRDKLASLLWPETSDTKARQNLRQVVATLRKTLPESPPALRVTEAVVALDGGVVDVDVGAFRRFAASATPAALEAAAALYSGHLLEGLTVDAAPFEEWLLDQREQLRELAMEVLARLLAHQRNAGQIDSAVQVALRLLALDSLQEATHRTLMRLYVTEGRRDAALRQYQSCVDVLRRELGVEPEPETRKLYEEILRQQASPVPEAQPAHTAAVGFRSYVPAPAAPLAGREVEMARLRSALAGAAHGRGRVVTVVGEAGIGKTRLVAELGTEALAGGVRLLRGLAWRGGEILVFGPWLDALRAAHVVQDAEVLRRIDPVWRSELARVLPELAAPGQAPSESPADPNRLFESFARLFYELAASAPLLVILEDLHLADGMSLRLLGFLARRIAAWPVLIVATAREEELADTPVLRDLLRTLSPDEQLMRVSLGTLSRREIEELVKALAPVRHDERRLTRLTEHIWAASEGNPFVAVETLTTLAVVPNAPEREAPPLPDRIREVVTGHLERLSGVSREIVRVSAVIGHEFEFTLAQHAAGLDEREAAQGFEELVRRRVFRVAGERFAFAHERIRQVAYDQILLPLRRAFHLAVAQAIESVYADALDAHAAVLGRHYFESEQWEAAARCFWDAGRRAAARTAHHEAIACFDQALAALDRLSPTPERLAQGIDVRFDLRHSLLPTGAPEAIMERLHEADSLARQLGDEGRLSWVRSFLALQFIFTGDYSDAVAAAREALAAADERNDPQLRVHANYCLTSAYLSLGDYDRGADTARAGIEALPVHLGMQRLGIATLPLLLCRASLALNLAETGDFCGARAAVTESLDVAEKFEHRYAAVLGECGGGFVCALEGDLPAAAVYFERGLVLCRAGQFDGLLPFLAGGLGLVRARLTGDAASVVDLVEHALDQDTPIGPMFWKELLDVWLAEGYLLAGRARDAEAQARRALSLVRQRRAQGLEAWTLRLLGDIVATGDTSGTAARECYDAALDLAVRLGMRPLEGRCRLSLGVLAGRACDIPSARRELTAAAALFRACGMTTWRAETEKAVRALDDAGLQ